MIIRRFAFVVVFIAAASAAEAYQSNPAGVAGRWRNYTDMRSVQGLQRVGGQLWAATSGGAFVYTPSSNSFSRFTNSEGLSTNSVTAVTVDGKGRLWFGTTEGFVNMHDPTTGAWREVRGIAESNHVQKAVRSFFAHNDTLFVGTEFGVAVYLPQTEEFADSYVNFGFVSQPRVNDIVVHQNTIWVATDSGIASASLSMQNLSSPQAWTRYATGTNSRVSNALAVYSGTVYAGTSNGLSFFQNGTFTERIGFFSKLIVAMEPSSGGQLFVVSNTSQSFIVEAISSESTSPQSVAFLLDVQATSLASQPATGDLWVGTPTRGMAHWNGTTWSYAAPNGPASNLFPSLAVDENGVLWAASGISGRGAGFYRFDLSQPDGARWKNFSYEEYPIMGNSPTDPERNDYYKVSVGANGSVWVSSWGRGVVEVRNDSVLRRLAVPPFSTTDVNDPFYPVIGSAAADENGATWFANRTAQSRNHLVRLTGDATFTYYAPSGITLDGYFTNMVVDRNGTKWIASAEPHNKPLTAGLAYFNETPGVVSGTAATNGWGVLVTPTIPNNVVLSLVVDLDGDVCLGTDAGMLFITQPRNPTQQTFRPLATLGQTVQAIAVDAVNNKWVGTREGILVLSPDGVQLLNSYTVESTQGKLLTNDIRALAIDQQRGILYVGTEKGLSSLEISAVQASRSYTTLEFGPNPFYLPNSDQLVIRNLAANSSIRILTTSGALVREFPAQGGGRAFWDGRNSDGEFVPTGIYFVVAYTENGNQLTTGKIAVVRR